MISFSVHIGRKEETRPERLEEDETAWPFVSDSPVIEDVVSPDRTLSIMLVNLCGLDWPEIEPLLPLARQGADEQQMLAVLVVDITGHMPLHNAGFAYDVLPNVDANTALLPDLDWRAYFARRRALLIEKWRPEAIVHLGSDRDW